MKRRGKLFLFAFFSVGALSGWAQCREVKWPENKAAAEERVALYDDAIKQGHYATAAKPLQWMLQNAPDWNIKLYIDACKVYDKLASGEKDPSKQAALVDTLLWVYDQRVKYCADAINVLNRKVYSAYKYQVMQKDKARGLLAMYDSLADLAKDKLADNNLVAYMTTVQANGLMLKNLSEEEILSRYDRIVTLIDKGLKDAESKGSGGVKSGESREDKLKEYRSSIDDILVTLVKVDCGFVKKNLAAKFHQNPNDIALAKKIFGFMTQGKCLDDPLWLEAGEAVLKQEKDIALIKSLASQYVKSGNTNRAQELVRIGLGVTQKADEKADLYIYMGNIEAKQGGKSRARDYFRQATVGDKRGYEEIGDLYYNSFGDCAKRENMAEDRLVYIAAYNMYKLAGDNQKMAQSRAQFPSKEELFLLNWKTGDTAHIGCWIGEDVVLSTRD